LLFCRQPKAGRTSSLSNKKQELGRSQHVSAMGKGDMKKAVLSMVMVVGFVLSVGSSIFSAQESEPDIHVIVNMVQLNVAVTDNKGNYVSGLHPQDFVISEDGITQKIATFGEGNEPTRRVVDVPGSNGNGPSTKLASEELPATGSGGELSSLLSGANVFVLFDTSNYMYRGFVFAQDAIADFVRSLESANKIAFYSYSRDLSRSSPLTEDRGHVIQSVRSSVAGDDAALYNCLLLTVKDAAQYRGRKVIVVFSNGPDNFSVVPPEDVAELAQSTGTVIYMISTREAQLEPVSSAVFERMTAATGGKAYFAKNWREEKQAFASIRDDLAHLYSLSYYPKANPNRGWRAITVRLIGEKERKYHIRTRNGYRPLPSRFAAENRPIATPQEAAQ
jgi:VWFA-related protein